MKEWTMRRSDLALEVVEAFMEEKTRGQTRGMVKKQEELAGLTVTTLDVLSGYEKQIGKKAGRYVSIDTSRLGLETADKLEQTRKVFSDQLQRLLAHKKIDETDTCLVVGLGNEHITPDALGPLTLDHVIVTRHLYEMDFEDMDPNYREVSALVPGVMGLTGIETYDIIESVVKKIKPDFLIVVDALAARVVSRVNKMIQITDTGISPGSGVGNGRRKIDEASLGIPVIAVGIPTVVDAVSVTHDTMDLLLKHLVKTLNEKATLETGTGDLSRGGLEEEREASVPVASVRKEFLGKIGLLEREEKRQLLMEVLTPAGYNLMVTPKTIDSEMEDLSRLVSNALNVALHPKISFQA